MGHLSKFFDITPKLACGGFIGGFAKLQNIYDSDIFSLNSR